MRPARSNLISLRSGRSFVAWCFYHFIYRGTLYFIGGFLTRSTRMLEMPRMLSVGGMGIILMGIGFGYGFYKLNQFVVGFRF